MSNAFAALLQSRKFLLLCLDTVISLILAIVGLVSSPEVLEHVKVFVAILQPVFVAIILAISIEDAAEKGAAVKNG